VNLAEALAPAPMAMAHQVMKALSADQISQHMDVLWVLDDASRLSLERPVPPHMLAVPAAPHLEVLRHARVRAVVSQSSLEAVSEALWHGLPMVGLPLRGYDRGACTLAQDAGAARCLLPSGKRAWTAPQVIVEAVLEVAGAAAGAAVAPSGGPSPFQAHARRLAAIMQAAGGVPRAADLVELAARVGLAHLEQPRLEIGLGMGTTWLSGSMVDVRLALFLVLLLLYWAAALAFRLARRLFRWSKYLKKDNKEEEEEGEEDNEGPDGKVHGNGINGNGITGAQPPLASASPSQPPRSRPGSLGGTPQPPALHASTSAPGGLDRPSPLSAASVPRANGGGNGGGSGRERPPLPPGSSRDR
jgi:hypothetical protein